MPKPVRSRAAARRVIEAAVVHYADQGGVELADRFTAAVEAQENIATLPSSGSPRLARVDVLRLLHERRDILRALTNP